MTQPKSSCCRARIDRECKVNPGHDESFYDVCSKCGNPTSAEAPEQPEGWWHPYIARIQQATMESNQKKADKLMEEAIAQARRRAFEECREMVDSEQLDSRDPYVKLGIEKSPYHAIETFSWNRAISTILIRLDGKLKEI